MRIECMRCDNKIEEEGDPFCIACDPHYALSDEGEVISINEYYITECLFRYYNNPPKQLIKELVTIMEAKWKQMKG